MVFSIKEDDLEQVQALSTHAKVEKLIFFVASMLITSFLDRQSIQFSFKHPTERASIFVAA